MKVVIDTDIGNGIAGANTDDGLALALAIASEEIDLLAVTTVSGNVSNIKAYNVAKNIIDDLGLDIPVYLGAAKALLEDEVVWRNRLDNSVYEYKLEHLWNECLELKNYEVPDPNASLELIKLARKYKNELIICAIGPLTNIAIACILDKDFASNLKELIIMGSTFDMPNHHKDTNFAFDPEAAKIVLQSKANITLVPYNITMQTSLQDSDLNRFNDGKLSKFIKTTLKPWISYAQITRNTKGTWIHDAITVAYLIDKSISNSQDYYVDVVVDSAYRGISIRSKKESKMIGLDFSKMAYVKILEDINNEKLLNLLIDKINKSSYEN